MCMYLGLANKGQLQFKKAMGKIDAHSLRIKMMASYLNYLVTIRCTKAFIFDEI